MSKRANVNGQQRREDFEADEGDDEDTGTQGSAGTFQRASEGEMAKRKIISVSRKPIIGGALIGSKPEAVSSKKPTNIDDVFPPSIPTLPAASSNPFASIKLVKEDNAKVNTSSDTNQSNISNIFTSTIKPITAIEPTKPSQLVSSNVFSINSTTITNNNNVGIMSNDQQKKSNSIDSKSILSNNNSNNSNDNNNESEYKKKIKKLNQSILSWMEKQIVDHPISVWKDGIKDYIKYCLNLGETYPNEAGSDFSNLAANVASESDSVPTTKNIAPVSVPAASISLPTTKINQISSGTNGAKSDFGFPVQLTQSVVATTPKEVVAPKDILATQTNTSTLIPPIKSNIFNLSSDSASNPITNSTATLGSTSTSNIFGSSANIFGTNGSSANIFGTNSSNIFNVNTTSANLFASNSNSINTGAGDGDGDGDGEEIPILEPEKVLKNSDDTDEILVESSCKLLKFNKETKEWLDLGKGVFRVTLNPTDKKRRILIRNTIGKVILNISFYKGMKFQISKNQKSGIGSIQFSGYVLLNEIKKSQSDPDEFGFQMFSVKVKDADLSKSVEVLEESVQKLG